MTAAIVTDADHGPTCRAAVISRALGIPCVVGTGDATRGEAASAAPVSVPLGPAPADRRRAPTRPLPNPPEEH